MGYMRGLSGPDPDGGTSESCSGEAVWRTFIESFRWARQRIRWAVRRRSRSPQNTDEQNDTAEPALSTKDKRDLHETCTILRQSGRRRSGGSYRRISAIAAKSDSCGDFLTYEPASTARLRHSPRLREGRCHDGGLPRGRARLVRARPDARPSRFPPRLPASTKARQRSGGAPADDSESRCGGGPRTHGRAGPVEVPDLGEGHEAGRPVGGDAAELLLGVDTSALDDPARGGRRPRPRRPPGRSLGHGARGARPSARATPASRSRPTTRSPPPPRAPGRRTRPGTGRRRTPARPPSRASARA